jgi:hypothetical protein
MINSLEEGCGKNIFDGIDRIDRIFCRQNLQFRQVLHKYNQDIILSILSILSKNNPILGKGEP